MTKTATMSQTRIQRAKTKNSENLTKTRGGEQIGTSCVFQLVLYGKSCEVNRKLGPVLSLLWMTTFKTSLSESIIKLKNFCYLLWREYIVGKHKCHKGNPIIYL